MTPPVHTDWGFNSELARSRFLNRKRFLDYTENVFCVKGQSSLVIPGSKSVEQALDNFAAADKRLPAQVVQSLYALWENEIKGDPLPW
jgi:hypothetical protein